MIGEIEIRGKKFQVKRTFSYDMSLSAVYDGELEESFLDEDLEIEGDFYKVLVQSSINYLQVQGENHLVKKKTELVLGVKRDLERQLRFWLERLESGYDFSELWNLDCSIVKYICDRLERMKEVSGVFWFNNKGEEVTCQQVSQEIQDGLKLYLKSSRTKAEERRMRHSFQVLKDNFSALWI